MVEVVSTSSCLPLNQRAWVCVWCGEGLPELENNQHRKSVQAHLKLRHPRRDKSAAASNRARGLAFRRDRNSVPQMTEAKKSLGRKLRERASANRDMHAEGHNLVEVNVNWLTWPSNEKRKRPGASLLTCTTCLIVRRPKKKWTSCPGSCGKISSSQLRMWNKLDEQNRLALCRAWNREIEDASAIFQAVAAKWKRVDFDWKGHEFVSIQFKRDLWPEEVSKIPKYLYTCTRCRAVRQSLGVLNRCPGLERCPTTVQKTWWSNMSSAVHIRKKLCEAWKCSLVEANAWFKKELLLQHGDVESHPGPGDDSLLLHVVSLNCGGCPGVWRALDQWLCDSPVDVLLLQEVAAHKNEIGTIKRAAYKRGYCMQFQLGRATIGRWKEERPRGGVALFIRSTLPQKPAFAECGLDSQIVGAWIAGWLVCSAYAPPAEHAAVELGNLLLNNVHALSLQPLQPWLVGGDFNQLPDSAVLVPCFRALNGFPVASWRTTRWSSTRCVDWFASNFPLSVAEPVDLSVAISDHVPLMVVISVDLGHILLGSLNSSPSYVRPADVPADTWRQTVEQAWGDCDRLETLNGCLLSSSVDVDAEWNLFLDVLQRSLLEACRRLSVSVAVGLEGRNACMKLARKSGSKGGLASFSNVDAVAGQRHALPDPMAVRKTRRWLARLYEARRLMFASHGVLTEQQKREWQCLRAKMSRKYGRVLSLRDLELEIRQLGDHLKNLDSSVKNQRLKAWRDELLTCDKSLGAWLRSKTNPCGAYVCDSLGRVADSLKDSATVIFDYWRNFWNAAEGNALPVDVRCQNMLHGLPDKQEETWGLPSGADLFKRAACMRGSAGPDSWVGAELRWLPQCVFDVFALIGRRWVEAGAAPCQFTESRMVMLPKPGKLSDLNVVSVVDLRPITVLSCWWRLWVGSLLRTSDVARWISLNVPDEFAVGNCVSTEQCVVELLEKSCRQKYMLSLDFSKAFDRLHPEITRRLLLKLGWPRGIVETLSFVWSRQQRWVCWSNHVHHQKLPSPALPQGDPCGPLIMTLWVIQGLAHVERVAGGSAFTRIYVDDRNIVANDPQDLKNRLDAWCGWSGSVGMAENTAKAFAIARGAAAVRRLRQCLPDQVVPELDLLGVSTRVNRRSSSLKEKARIGACRSTIGLLSCLNFPFEKYMRSVRLFAMSKFVYGWLARFPSWEEARSLWAKVSVGSRRLRAASPWLKAALFGGNCHPDVLCATRLVGILGRMRLQVEQLDWSMCAGHPVKALHTWLCKRGWKLIRPFVWKCDDCRAYLDLEEMPFSVGELQHRVRSAWRAWCLRNHLASVRRDASSVDIFGAPNHFNHIDWDATRAWALSSGAARTVACGASFSPAALGGRTGRSIQCVWNCGAPGTWDHCCWECPHRPVVIPKPQFAIVARFGWFLEHTFPNPELHRWLVRVQTIFWDLHHGRD